MPIQVACECGKTLNLPDHWAGKAGKCPQCGKLVQVPAPDVVGTGAPMAAIPLPPAAMGTQPLGYAAPAMPTGGPIAPPPSDVIFVPTEVPPKLRDPALPPLQLVISTAGTDVNCTFDASAVLGTFVETFARQLRKKFDVRLGPPAADQAAPLVFVRAVRIDEGNRWLRYFFAFFAGATVFEIDGHVSTSGGHPIPFSFTNKGRLGVFGGDSLGLLKLKSRQAIARLRQVVQGRKLKTLEMWADRRAPLPPPRW